MDTAFLQNLSRNYKEIDDSRVAQGMSSMLQRKIIIISSSGTDAEPSSHLYRPFQMNSSCDRSSIALGHINDHHFVLLKRRGTA